MELNSIESKFNKGKFTKEDTRALINYAFGLSEKIYNLQNELDEYNESLYKKLSVDELIKLIRTHNQINIYTVYEQWCVQLFDLSICPNDIDVSCNWESSDISLKKVLIRAIEHIAEY
jgi:hypothetical protein